MKYSKRRKTRRNKSKKNYRKKKYIKKIKGGNNKVYIIKIWASWCGHCISLNKIWDEVKKKSSNVEFIEVENSEIENGALEKLNKDLKLNGSNEITVDGYPTLVKVTNDKMEKYEGARDISSLVVWINNS
jgi:thiol-disulfide isomerase/thioredoxin